MKLKNVFFVLLIAILGGFVAIGGSKLLENKQGFPEKEKNNDSFARPVKYNDISNTSIDFTYAAEKAVHGVVHIKTAYAVQHGNTLYDFLFRDQQQSPYLGSGSGVILSPDGYIVTNNHVVEMSNEIEVVLDDKRTFKAKLVGKDPSTDLALLKIDANDLAVIPIGNSDDIRIGEWVLAVGNPFNLTSTVTAGIISAKGRNINIMQGQYSIESFIQTDAAVNPGNSGGALVNIKGELVGVNAAIATKTGSFSGYSFAIPASIVEKVVSDLKEYGIVQRALLGVSILDVDAEIAKSLDLEKIEGVLVDATLKGGSAEKAGILKNDIIIKVGSASVNKVAELQEKISRYRPGDKVDITLIRDKKIKKVTVLLQNKIGNTDIISSDVFSVLGANFSPLSKKELEKLGLNSGVRVTELAPGKLLKAGVREGYIITHINRLPVNSLGDIDKALKDASGGVYIRGIYPNGLVEYYAFGLD